MAAAADKSFLKGIVSHAFSPDRKQVVVAPNSEEVYIYDSEGQDATKWDKKFILTEHEGFVSAVDWCRTGLVTAGHDRNAYVWAYDAKEENFKPSLVLLRINRAATAVKWSPSGLKFAVASASKVIPICHYAEDQNWWLSDHIKKVHKSTVTSLAWSPNSKFILSGSTDFKCRINSAFITNIDSKELTGYEFWGESQNEFGHTLLELGVSGWVNAVSWAPGGYDIAFATHASSLTFAHIQEGAPKVQTIFCQGMPYLDIAFLDDSTLVGVGYDCNPHLFKREGGGEWKFIEAVDKSDKKAVAAGGKASAFSKWAEADKRGREFGSEPVEVEVATRHKNPIVNIRPFGSKDFTTAGIDGRILFWKIA
jgi:actin related protein 2/3 complex subunit 1A/1B